ncbi:MAG: DMT family transporter [Chloroflexota bacterium]
MKRNRPSPELIVAVAAAVWGLFWIPLRAFERQGLDPGWGTLTQFLAPLVVLMPFALWRWRRNQPTGIQQYRSGILIGMAVSLYVQSLFLTDVARSLILFYAMPAWGTLLEVFVMRRSLTWWRGLSLVLSVAGLLIILSVGDQFTLSMNIGDSMALLSGFLFALGAIQVRQDTADVSVFEQLFAFFFYGSGCALALSLLPLDVLGQPPALGELIKLTPWFILMAVGFLIPVMGGIYWGSRHVDPGRLGILLQLEAIVGIGSAAIFAGEPFGIQQALGAILVISAGLVEVIPTNTERLPL